MHKALRMHAGDGQDEIINKLPSGTYIGQSPIEAIRCTCWKHVSGRNADLAADHMEMRRLQAWAKLPSINHIVPPPCGGTSWTPQLNFPTCAFGWHLQNHWTAHLLLLLQLCQGRHYQMLPSTPGQQHEPGVAPHVWPWHSGWVKHTSTVLPKVLPLHLLCLYLDSSNSGIPCATSRLLDRLCSGKTCGWAGHVL